MIYVARNPKDVAVSFYHFHRLAKFLPDPGSFDTFLTRFIEGTGKGWGGPWGPGTQRGPSVTPHLPPPVHYGSWFDHVKGWLAQRQLLDIFYVTYEELHQVSPGACPRPRLCRLPQG